MDGTTSTLLIIPYKDRQGHGHGIVVFDGEQGFWLLHSISGSGPAEWTSSTHAATFSCIPINGTT
jgi:hypothetical protein